MGYSSLGSAPVLLRMPAMTSMSEDLSVQGQYPAGNTAEQKTGFFQKIWEQIKEWVLGTPPFKAPAWMNGNSEDTAIKYCRAEIAYYSNIYETNLRRWRRWQIVTISFGGIATISGAASGLIGNDWRWAVGIPAAISTIAASILAAFNYQSDALRQATTADSLQGELCKYLCGTTPYTGSDKRNIFVNNIRDIVAAEQRKRRSQYEKPQANGGDEGTIKERRASTVKIATIIPDAIVNTHYQSPTIQAAGGTPPLAWSVDPPLPSGLSLDAPNGVISGKPTTVSPKTEYTITVTDSAQPPASSTAKVTLEVKGSS
jgi:hypothetical protein